MYATSIYQLKTQILYNQRNSSMGQEQSSRPKPDVSKVRIDKSKRGISFGLASMKGWRKFMEDTYIANLNFNEDPELSLFAIFDGHSGSQIAILVRDQFPKELKKNKYFQNGRYPQALRQTFMKMDEIIQSDYGIRKLQEIIEEECSNNNAKNLFGQSKAGCTALVCLVTPNIIFIANAGDSRGIAFANNQCIQVNNEHKPELQGQQHRIKQAGGTITHGRINGQINISRCIGDLSFKKNINLERNQQMIICDPQIIEIERQTCEYILLGSDGIWQSKNNLAMHHWIKGLSYELKASKKLAILFDQQISKVEDSQHGKDNMTAILIEFY